jgi:hypothetical protein
VVSTGAMKLEMANAILFRCIRCEARRGGGDVQKAVVEQARGARGRTEDYDFLSGRYGMKFRVHGPEEGFGSGQERQEPNE